MRLKQELDDHASIAQYLELDFERRDSIVQGPREGSVLDGEVVDETGAVGSMHEPGDLEGFAVLVEAGVQDVEDGYARWQVERLRFLVAGHPGDDFVLAAGHGVAAFFEPTKDAARSGLGLQ
jgi:hypothetical protein